MVFLALLALVDSGCGGSSADNPATKGNTVQAAADRRIKFKDEYKKMLGKDGKMLWNPSQSKKRPAGVP
jgi:hypothetical protein